MFNQPSTADRMASLPIRPIAATSAAFAGLVLFSLGFAAVALDSVRERLDPAQLADADRLRVAAPFLVAIGIVHFVALFGLLDGPGWSRLTALGVGLVGTFAAAAGLVELAVLGDPARVGGHDVGSGVALLVTAIVLYGAVAAGAIQASPSTARPAPSTASA